VLNSRVDWLIVVANFRWRFDVTSETYLKSIHVDINNNTLSPANVASCPPAVRPGVRLGTLTETICRH
jgi:hypothetical protein